MMSIRAPALRGSVELVDDLRIDEMIELEPDARVPPVGGRRRNGADLVDESAAERERGDEQLAELLRAAEAGDVVEEIGDVGRDLLVGREDPEILVQPRGRRVVVPGADVRVPAQRVALTSDDEGHLRVDLQVGESVRDVDAGLLERSRPLDVAELVEARLELDEAHRLLSVLGALDERPDEHAVVARPVHRGLHRDDVRVADGRLREHLEARDVRAVRLVHEHVAAPDLLEDLRDVGLRAREPRRNRRYPRLILQLGAVERCELEELGEVERALDAIDLRLVRSEAALQARDHLGRRGRADLDADDVAEAAAAQLRLDGLEQVVGVVGDLEVGIARDPEHGTLDDLHTREERRKEVGDDLLERDVEPATEVEEAREALGDLHARETLLAGVGILGEDRKREREPRDVGEGLSRADRERREHRVDLAFEPTLELLQLLRAEVLDAADRDLLRGERRA